jgi:hypothetical protein
MYPKAARWSARKLVGSGRITVVQVCMVREFYLEIYWDRCSYHGVAYEHVHALIMRLLVLPRYFNNDLRSWTIR